MNLLHIDSSPRFEQSVTRQLGLAIASAWQKANPEGTIIRRDVAAQPIAHLEGALLNCLKYNAAPQDDEELAVELSLTNALIAEFLAADAVIVGAPMFNLSIPSQLKSWIDRLCVPGRTFRYSATGPVGLVVDKPTYIVSSRGGIYSSPEKITKDQQEPYLKSILGMLGLRSIMIVRAEGVDISPELRKRAIDDAMQKIQGLFSCS
jgi:FMN-dependent NADH-azoreductase